jgi:hypothetical protein
VDGVAAAAAQVPLRRAALVGAVPSWRAGRVGRSPRADRGTRRLHEQLDTAKHGEQLRQITHGLIEADNYRRRFTAIDL